MAPAIAGRAPRIAVLCIVVALALLPMVYRFSDSYVYVELLFDGTFGGAADWHQNATLPTKAPTGQEVGPPEHWWNPTTDDWRVSIVVFCCRENYFDILDTYLLNNLKSRGGLVDEVLFLINTVNSGTIEMVESVAAVTPEYRVVPRPIIQSSTDFVPLYGALQDPRTIYFKIDDDTVFIHPDAIANMIRGYRTYGGAYCVLSANVINHTRLGHYHQSTAGAIPIPSDPMALRFEDDPYGRCSLVDPRCAMLAHNTFLSRIADGTVEMFSGNDSVHELGMSHSHNTSALVGAPHVRWSINAIVLTKQMIDVMRLMEKAPYGEPAATDGLRSDEMYISSLWPTIADCECAALLDVIVVHYAYNPQNAHLLFDRDLLPKYRSLAKQMYGDFRGKLVDDYPIAVHPKYIFVNSTS